MQSFSPYHITVGFLFSSVASRPCRPPSSVPPRSSRTHHSSHATHLTPLILTHATHLIHTSSHTYPPHLTHLISPHTTSNSSHTSSHTYPPHLTHLISSHTASNSSHTSHLTHDASHVTLRLRFPWEVQYTEAVHFSS